MINQIDYVELGLACAEVCTALDRGLDGRRLNELNSSVCEAISQLTMRVTPPTYNLSSLFMIVSPWPQNRCGDPEKNHQGGQTKCTFSTPPRKERQGKDRGLEVRPHQDPPRLQCAFHHFRMAVANSAFLDRAYNKHTHHGLRYPSYDCKMSGKKRWEASIGK